MTTRSSHPAPLDQELTNLNKEFLKLSTMVEERLQEATQLIASPDPDLIESLIDGDDEVDELEVKIEGLCIRILALHQPFASDLRFLISVIKINRELERISDITVNIAMRVMLIMRIGGRGKDLPFDFTDMSDRVRIMLRRSIDSLINRNAELARTIFDRDDDVDNARNQCYELVTEALKNCPQHPGVYLNTYILAQHLERIADRAVNIAEEVVYLVEGKVTRFP